MRYLEAKSPKKVHLRPRAGQDSWLSEQEWNGKHDVGQFYFSISLGTRVECAGRSLNPFMMSSSKQSLSESNLSYLIHKSLLRGDTTLQGSHLEPTCREMLHCRMGPTASFALKLPIANMSKGIGWTMANLLTC